MRFRLFAVLACVVFTGAAAFGQGVIIPNECHRCPPLPRPLFVSGASSVSRSLRLVK